MVREFQIADRRIVDDGEPFVVAEIGHNHQGSLRTCRQLFEAARQAGADAVKLQKRDNRSLYTRAYYDRPYDNENSFGPTYGLHREALEFGWDQYVELKANAESLGLVFFATAFDRPSVDFLDRLGVPAIKIASADLTNISLIEYAAHARPLILSTGAASMRDVQEAHALVLPRAFHAFLHCTAIYPAPAEALNLRAIATMHRELECVVGYSSHFAGISMPLVAYMLGARIIECHFTLNRAMKGTDHAFSLEPNGLRRLVRDLRRARAALGDGVKVAHEGEGAAVGKMGKAAYAARDLPIGHIVTWDDIVFKTPGGGIPPSRAAALIGRPVTQPMCEEEPFR